MEEIRFDIDSPSPSQLLYSPSLPGLLSYVDSPCPSHGYKVVQAMYESLRAESKPNTTQSTLNSILLSN
jgi:hypothetical protein